MASMTATQHSHRSTTKVLQKPFKSRHLSKSALKDIAKGKIEKGVRKTAHQQMMSKMDRRNQAKQKRLTKEKENDKKTSVFNGRDGAPRIVAVVSLAGEGAAERAVASLNKSLDLQEPVVPEKGMVTVHVERFKQNVLYYCVQRRLLDVLDACRIADFVVLVLSATEEVDEYGEELLKAVENQGISNVVAVAEGIDSVEPPKKRPQVLNSLKSYANHFFPTIEKVNSLDSRQECVNAIRSLCSSVPKGIKWREDRSWMLVEDVRWSPADDSIVDNVTSEVILTGVVRGRGLKADRLVQVGDWGSYQISKVTAAPLEKSKKGKGNAMAVDGEGQGELLEQPSDDLDGLEDLAPEEVAMEDAADYAMSIAPSDRKGVLLDDHHYFSDEETRIPDRTPKRLPRGTSKYQAAWYLDDLSDSGSDLTDYAEEMFDDVKSRRDFDPADGFDDSDMRDAMTEGGPSEYPQSEAFLDPSPDDEAEQIAAYRQQRKEEAKDDLQFPDEIELEPTALARERLVKYRGLKSLRTSVWDAEEDKLYEPSEWARLLEVSDYKGARNRVLRDSLIGGVQPGTRVNIHLSNVSLALQKAYDPTAPLPLFSLLRHEQKRTAVNFSITLSSDITSPLRSKEELIMQCGPRRFIINPLFSDTVNTPNNVHKFQRYIHPGRAAIASFTAPLTWGSVPTLFFRRHVATGDLALVATGTSLPPSTNRIIAKRIILTGHPYKINKRVVTVRYMFFNKEDVLWFKALKVWTKKGRTGFIKESLGTHGYLKAVFDGKLDAMDAIGVSLYKRVWPRSARAWSVLDDVPQEEAVPQLVEGGEVMAE
jgi:pre-rRNA-processing protein TSR1